MRRNNVSSILHTVSETTCYRGERTKRLINAPSNMWVFTSNNKYNNNDNEKSDVSKEQRTFVKSIKYHAIMNEMLIVYKGSLNSFTYPILMAIQSNKGLNTINILIKQLLHKVATR